MSIGPAGIPVGAAGAPLAQTAGEETERVAQAVDARRRSVYHNRKAGSAAGVSPPDGEDHEPGQRDADGRVLYDAPPRRKTSPGATQPRKAKDHRKQSGNLLDETG